MGRATAKAYQAHREVLEQFESEYRQYVDAQRRGLAGYAVDQAALGRTRGELLRRVPRVARALEAADTRIVISPPPMFGGPLLTALAQQVFAHETSTYGSGDDPFATADMVLDLFVTGLGVFDDRIEHAESVDGGGPVGAAAGVRRIVGRGLPTLWGNLRHVPRWVGTIADFATVGALIAGGLKLVGLV